MTGKRAGPPCRCQLRRQELLEALQVARDHLQDEVDLAVQHMAFAHFGQGVDMVLERLEIGLGLALEADHREHGDGVAQHRRIDHGMIGGDGAGFLQRTDTAQARRCRQPDLARQIHIGHPAIVLQFAQDLQVDVVDIGPRHQIDYFLTCYCGRIIIIFQRNAIVPLCDAHIVRRNHAFALGKDCLSVRM